MNVIQLLKWIESYEMSLVLNNKLSHNLVGDSRDGSTNYEADK